LVLLAYQMGILTEAKELGKPVNKRMPTEAKERRGSLTAWFPSDVLSVC
jgi:hypothetical protein